MTGPHLDTLEPAHWEDVRAIYLEGIRTGNATFEQEAPEWESWNRAHLPRVRWVALDGSRVVGWAALSPVSNRCVYGGVAEVSVYVAGDQRGRGVGGALLGALISSSEAHGIWTLQAGIFPENRASVALHRRNGFREIGVRERVGKLKGVAGRAPHGEAEHQGRRGLSEEKRMAAYVAVQIEIHDPVVYARYRELAPPSIDIYGGRYLVRGGESVALEGSWHPPRFVLLEFPSVDHARRWWSSPEYAPAKALRHSSSSTEMLLVEGVG